MPKWDYLPIGNERATHRILSLSPGRWVVTDGAYLTKDFVEIGPITIHDGFLDLTQTPDGLELLTLGYKVQPPIAKRPETVLVIDSGSMVFCCEDAFKRDGIVLTDHRTSYAFEETARLAGKSSSAVLIHDANRHCIGIFARPMFGDGAYRLEFGSAGEFEAIHAHLGESC